MFRDRFIPAAAEQPTLFKDNLRPEDTFDVASILDALLYDGSDGLAKALDEMIHELTVYYLDHDGNHTGSRDNLFRLKLLRDAFLKGGKHIEFRR